MLRVRAEFQRDVGRAELEQVLDRRARRLADRVRLELRLLAQADEERALVLVAQQDEAGGRAVEFRFRHALGLRRALKVEANEIGRTLRGGADVDFNRGHETAMMFGTESVRQAQDGKIDVRRPEVDG